MLDKQIPISHCRDRYDQAVRLDQWKGIRLGKNNGIKLYDLSADITESHDVANQHPVIVKQIDQIMKNTVTPSERYPVGRIYEGKPLWSQKK
ncbi:MAG TPA: hypothetical protein EYQ50_13720 [Verrucomicrobiales bacterium]|nr:hypothetical protein [Verrucomicrobiales bacterium]